MEQIWCNIAHHYIGISYDDSKELLLSKNRWEDFYSNPKYKEHQCNNPALVQFVFRMSQSDICEREKLLLWYGIHKKNNNCALAYISNKLLLWYEIYRNPFLTNKEEISFMFSKVQRTYHVLLRFIDRIQKKYAKVRVKCDLNLETIELQEGCTVSLFQNQSQYYFTVSDLIKICNAALSYSDHMFPDAYVPKNPYTNQHFSYKALLQIYYAIRRSDYKMPLLLEMFYHANFSIKTFVAKYEYFIREEIIKNFVRNGSEEDICDYIYEMLDIGVFEKYKDKICPDFPRKILVKALKKYVFLYLISEYSLRSADRQYQYFNVLKASLSAFFNKNPTFGRMLSRRIDKIDETTGNPYEVREKYHVTDYIETNIIPMAYMKRVVHDVIFENNMNTDNEE